MPGSRHVLVALLITALGLAGCSPTVPAASVTPEVTAVAALEVDGRPVVLHVPETLDPAVPSALVVVLHGYTGSASGTIDYFGLRALADERGFLVAAPQGTTDPEGKTFWNASAACCNFHGSQVDDSGHLDRVITAVGEAHPVEEGRVYVVGHSNGAFMAHRFACDHADRVAAIASLAGALDVDAHCAPSRPVSVLQVHGEADDSILFDGGEIDGDRYTSARDTVAVWRRLDGCGAAGHPQGPWDADGAVPGDDLTSLSWTGCRAGTDVALWTIEDGGHVPALTAGFTAALYDWLEARAR